MNYLTRIDRLRGSLRQLGVDGMLVTDEIHVRYLTGFTGDSTYLLVTADEAMMLSDRRYETQLAQQCPNLTTLVRGPERKMIELIAEAVSSLSIKRMALEAAAITWETYATFSKAFTGVELVAAGDPVGELRMIKDESELAILRRAVWIAERAFESVTAKLRPTLTELQIAHELEATIRDLGGEGCGFAPIVGAGASGALPHYRPGDIAIGGSQTLLIDWGAKYCGYTSDLTRTLHRDHPPAGFQEAYEAVLAAHTTALHTIRAGVQAKEVDAAARQVLVDASLGPMFKHGLGHGIGLRIHEAPRMGAASEEVLAAGMVITVEPGVYFEHSFGIRIEDDVLVTPTGCQLLSTLPRDFAACRYAM
ncbi:MAG: M24 family metallopeptidase [Planctomycetaceae bacterium]